MMPNHINIRTILFLFLSWQMALFSKAICQTGFKKLPNIEKALSVDFDDIQYVNDQIIIRGNAYHDSLNIWGLLIAGLDTNGLVLWSEIIADTTRNTHIVTNTPSRFISSSQNQFIIPSYYYNRRNIVLIITDSLGQVLYENEYLHSGKTIYPNDVIEVSGYYYIFGMVQRENFLDDNFVVKVDSVSQLVWFKYYGSQSYHEDFGDVIDNKDGTMTVSSCIYSGDYYDPYKLKGWRRPWIFTIDTSGTIIWEWIGEKNDSRTIGGGPFYKASNGDWLMVGWDRKEIPLSEFNSAVFVSPTMTRMDSSFNQLWRINLTDYTGRYDKILDLEYDAVRDNIVAVGDLIVHYSFSHYESEAWIMKISGDGDILWNITDTLVYNRGERHATAGLALAPSGSIYVAGYVTVPPNGSYGWIIKVTTDGCTDTICTTTSILEQIMEQQRNVILFPNPVTDQLHLSIREMDTQAFFHVYDVNGRRVMTANVFEGDNTLSTDLTPGLYFYSVVSQGYVKDAGKFVVCKQ